MVNIAFDDDFKRLFSRIHDVAFKNRILRQFDKISENPLVGKPMRYARKGTREVYIPPFRLSYIYIEEKDLVVFLDLYHKDEQ